MSNSEVEAVVADALREGWTVTSSVGGTFVLTKPLPMTMGQHVLRLLGIVLLVVLTLAIWPPLVLLAIPYVIVWARDSRKTMRMTVYVDDSGEVIQAFN